MGRRHRFGYSVSTKDGSASSGSLLKHDLWNRSVASREFGAGSQVGEFVFVPSSVDAGEDEGVLMGFVYDAATQKSDLTILDAGTLETVGAVHLPDRVPNGFHGNWVGTE